MEIAEIVLRLVGGFYVFAGLAAMRGVVMDRMMDQMLSAISMEPQPPKGAQRRWIWGLSALAIGMGGAGLTVLNLWAVPLFAIGLLTQAGYLFWARTAFVPENPEEEKGRSQTINAAILYGAATFGVLAAAWAGMLHSWLDIWALIVPFTGLFIMLTVGRHLIWQPKKVAAFSDMEPEDDYPEDRPIPPLHRVRLEPRWGCHGLIDADTGEDCQPGLYLPSALAERIYNWQYAFHDTGDGSMSLLAEFEDPDHEAEHRREGEAIVAELRTIFGPDNADGPVYPEKIVYLGAGNRLKDPEN